MYNMYYYMYNMYYYCALQLLISFFEISILDVLSTLNGIFFVGFRFNTFLCINKVYKRLSPFYISNSNYIVIGLVMHQILII